MAILASFVGLGEIVNKYFNKKFSSLFEISGGGKLSVKVTVKESLTVIN